MTPTNVIFIDMPHLLRDILRGAVQTAGMTVRSEHENVPDALAALAACTCRRAVVGAAGLLDADTTSALRAQAPEACLLALEPDGHEALLHQPGCPAVALTDASPAALAAALEGER
jgi:hypothetical protein